MDMIGLIHAPSALMFYGLVARSSGNQGIFKGRLRRSLKNWAIFLMSDVRHSYSFLTAFVHLRLWATMDSYFE
jgi:hypothetical protein